jgi:hypothetical protein
VKLNLQREELRKRCHGGLSRAIWQSVHF